ncbi:MAG TPA: serine/threonine-protein kinase, partial [Oligoflexia bacterium]|nr:serine/threonine-protein kinase [Oligoflexia bacterium]
DFYSLGVILFELVTGKLPFDAENPVGLMWMHIHKEPVAPILLQPDTPEWLNDLILNMLAKTAAGRPPTADHIVTYLRKHFDPRTIKPGSNRKSLADAAQSFAEQRNAKVPELPISEILGEEWDESARDSVELERSSVQAAARETTWDVPAPESCVEQAGYPPAAHAKSGRQQIDEGTVVLEWRRLYRSVVVVFTVVLLTVAALVFHIIETRVAGRQGLKVIRDLPRIIKRTGPESVPHVGIDSFTALFTDNNTHADSRRIVLRDDFPMLAAVLAASAANRKAGSKDKASLPETNAKVYAALDKSYLDTLNSLAGAGSELRFSSAEIGEAMDRGRLMNLSPIEQFRKDYGALSSIAETAAKSASASPAAPAGIDRHRDVTGVLAQETAAREQLKLIEHELSILRLADDAAVAAERNRIMDRQQQISSARQQLFAALDVARKLYHVWLFRADLAQKTGSGSPELQRGLHTARSNLVQTVLLIAALQQEDAHNGQVLKFIEQRSEMPQNEQQIKSSQLSAIKGDVEIKLSSLAQELPAEQSAFLRFLQAFEAAAYL